MVLGTRYYHYIIKKEKTTSCYFIGSDNVLPKAVLRGHERGIDSVGVSPNSLRLATGGWDTNLKLWSATLEDDREEPALKRIKSSSSLITKTPLHTLKGHKETISSIKWVDNNEVCTVSMDHTIKFWDAEVTCETYGCFYVFAHCLFSNNVA